MAKRFLAILVLVCLLFCLLAACGEEKVTVISQDEAYAIAVQDLGEEAVISGSPHIHVGSYKNQVCYNIYLTVDGRSVSYVISTSGEILDKGNSSHSH